MNALFQIRRTSLFLIIATVCLNLILLTSAPSASANAAKPIPGKKGSIGGVDTCHCPDDSIECYCNS